MSTKKEVFDILMASFKESGLPTKDRMLILTPDADWFKAGVTFAKAIYRVVGLLNSRMNLADSMVLLQTDTLITLALRLPTGLPIKESHLIIYIANDLGERGWHFSHCRFEDI